MAFDFKQFAKDKLKGYKEQDEKRAAKKAGGNTNEIIWKPSEGENVIRIVPLKDNPNPFQELYFHYDFAGKKVILSPISFGERDPIEEFAKDARDEGGLSKEQWLETKKFDPKMRTYVPIIVRGEEDKGVRFWAFGITVYRDLLTAVEDPDYGELHDPNEGFDIKIVYTPKEKSNTDFAQTKVMIKPKSCKLGTTVQIKEWLANQPDLLSTWTRYSFDELKKILEDYLTPKAEESEARTTKAPADSGWGEEEEAPPAKKVEKTKTKVSDDVSKEFEDLFES